MVFECVRSFYCHLDYACYTHFSLGDRVLRVLSTIVLCGAVIVKLLMSSDIQYGRNVSLN